jgi:hypothetical protein
MVTKSSCFVRIKFFLGASLLFSYEEGERGVLQNDV